MPVAQDAVPIVASAYNAASDADAAEDIRIKSWMVGASRQDLATGIAATNVGTESIEARLSLRDSQYDRLVACGDPCTAALPARGTHYWWLPELPGIPLDPSYANGTVVKSGRHCRMQSSSWRPRKWSPPAGPNEGRSAVAA